MAAIVQINFDTDSSLAELEEHSMRAAPLFTDIPGLVWKIWLGNDSGGRAGGIYLFETRQHASDYAESQLVTHLKQNRSNVSVDIFEALSQPGTVTARNIPGLTLPA